MPGGRGKGSQSVSAPKLQILSSNNFVSGDLCTGNLRIMLTKPECISQVSIHLEVDQRSKCSGSKTVRDGDEKKQVPFSHSFGSVEVLDFKEYDSVGTLTAGDYSFGFQFLIPESAHSSSENFSTKTLSSGCSYRVVATLSPRRGTPVSVQKKIFVVQPEFFEFGVPYRTEEKEVSVPDDIKCSISITRPRRVFLFGEAPVYLLKVFSEEKKVLTFDVSIVRRVEMKYNGDKASSTDIVSSQKISLPPFFAGARIVAFTIPKNMQLSSYEDSASNGVSWKFEILNSKFTFQLLAGHFFGSMPRLPGSTNFFAFRSEWESDRKNCAVCSKELCSQLKFWAKDNMRHHCRFCGQSVCGKCASGWLQANETDFRYTKRHRCCSGCKANPPSHRPLPIDMQFDNSLQTAHRIIEEEFTPNLRIMSDLGNNANNNTNINNNTVAPVINVTCNPSINPAFNQWGHGSNVGHPPQAYAPAPAYPPQAYAPAPAYSEAHPPQAYAPAPAYSEALPPQAAQAYSEAHPYKTS
eukprot:CAMPEP_0175150260 /NCGR_PEP_ID=MMETSP0087-20121206/17761_1 /TAXON_ID=136419 /ORGANISM="Unknown Unknown, Strain D1" /LENGTH=522 /DNA_ID=CAMNT_0016436165 /DNA_START=74 /DNA_END=1642 /DNA_ORIENTATION=+